MMNIGTMAQFPASIQDNSKGHPLSSGFSGINGGLC